MMVFVVQSITGFSEEASAVWCGVFIVIGLFAGCVYAVDKSLRRH